jgi:hypothetical protein
VKRLSNAVIAVVGHELGSHYYNHGQLNKLFMEHGAPADTPPGNCVTKCIDWLKRANADSDVDIMALLGGVLEIFMEDQIRPLHQDAKEWASRRDRVCAILAKHGLTYHEGGQIVGGEVGAPTKSLATLIRDRDMNALEVEFKRAVQSVDSDPPAAVTAACAIVEAFCKVYIEDEQIEMPKEQTIKPLWKIVQKHLGLDPAAIQDDDISRILGGLASVVDGIGALRTHGGSAHGRGRTTYRLEARHARLAVHSAHTLTMFALETWATRRSIHTP